MVRENIVSACVCRSGRQKLSKSSICKGTCQPVVQVVLLDGDGEGTRREGRTSRMVQNSSAVRDNRALGFAETAEWKRHMHSLEPGRGELGQHKILTVHAYMRMYQA